MTLLKVSALSIRRGKTQILDSVNWEAKRGEHWVILGANGSGKTSLLSALTGYLTPTAGSMTLLGEEFGNSDWRALRTHVGLVSSSIRQMMPDHEPALITVASGRYAMIDFWGNPSRADREAARAMLRRVEALHLADRPWLYLSQGERQRILVGRAMMAKPRLLILDEPCAGMDPAAREQFLAFLERLGRKRGGPSLVLVTHHVEEIMPVFTHALILHQGKVLACGKKSATLSSRTLSKAFNARASLRTVRGRHTLTIRVPARSAY